MKKINKKGFTLVEIIITLAIVITITTVGGINVTNGFR